MALKFGTRNGDRLDWQRTMVFSQDPDAQLYVLAMRTQKDPETRLKVRKGYVFTAHFVTVNGESQVETDERLWVGDVPMEGPPLRATCVAAGIVDTNGIPFGMLGPGDDGATLATPNPAPNWLD